MEYKIKRFTTALELNKILEILSEEAALSDAASLALNTEPEWDADKVKANLNMTLSAFKLLSRASSPKFAGAANNSVAINRAVTGGVLNAKELLQIGDTLRVIRTLKGWRDNAEYPEELDIDRLFAKLQPNKYLEDTIFFSINGDESIKDGASQTLSDIRRKIKSATANIRNKLDSIVKGKNFAKYLQEAIVTQRDGRFVVPVKSEFRGEFPGIVHDSSSSGATLFIEPMSVVETNNDLRVLYLKEEEEIERILSELSAEVSNFADSIKYSYKMLVELCLIFAKANLAYKMKATVPNINTDGRIVLKNARHPLIDTKKVVPISLTLGTDYKSLIITGPNTGGKTVTLKTIGLLTLMAMCGLMVPCDDMSEIAVFDKILVDIGDEQSIEHSLSTFSSHMVNIVSIIENATPFSLVLLDELGAGTDPIEGAALARAILSYLAKKGTRIAATTHYAELKTYALDTDGVENASCEFDIETLRPTYRLLIGVPGRSNAFAISQKLGVDDQIIDEAKGYISEENSRFEKIISSLEKERQIAEREREEISALKAELLNQKRSSDKKYADINALYEKTVEKARNDATYIIDNARYKANTLINELEDIKKKIDKENAANNLKNAKLNVKNTLNSLETDINPVADNKTDYVLPRKLVVGDRVRLVDLGKDADVLEIKNQKVLVLAGNLKIWSEMSNVILLDKPKTKQPAKRTVTGINSGATRQASLEFDMRGMNTDEGIIELDRFIDNAVMSGIGTVTIIHGKGTGVLRTAVQNHLRRHKNIETFRIGLFGEGENGVTIAEIKK